MLMLFLFALFVQGTLSAQNFSAIAPAECVSGEEFYNPDHPRFLLYCIRPGSYNVTGEQWSLLSSIHPPACLDTTFSKVPFNSYVDLAEATYKHLGFRYQCLLIEDQKQKIARLQYTGTSWIG